MTYFIDLKCHYSIYTILKWLTPLHLFIYFNKFEALFVQIYFKKSYKYKFEKLLDCDDSINARIKSEKKDYRIYHF